MGGDAVRIDAAEDEDEVEEDEDEGSGIELLDTPRDDVCTGCTEEVEDALSTDVDVGM